MAAGFRQNGAIPSQSAALKMPTRGSPWREPRPRAGGANGNVWQRLAQLGTPVSREGRLELDITSFPWNEVYDKPSLVTEPLLAKLPAIQQILAEAGDSGNAAPGYVDEQHEITKINAQRVLQIANWTIDGTEYWLTRADYQTGNSSTPQDQYLHIISGNPASDPSGALRITDLSTRLTLDGTLAIASTSRSRSGIPGRPTLTC